jgi:hypothetical protein
MSVAKLMACHEQIGWLEMCIEEKDKMLATLISALEQIADPRKRDHKEPDTYTELGCVMNIASEALKAVGAE